MMNHILGGREPKVRFTVTNIWVGALTSIMSLTVPGMMAMTMGMMTTSLPLGMTHTIITGTSTDTGTETSGMRPLPCQVRHGGLTGNMFDPQDLTCPEETGSQGRGDTGHCLLGTWAMGGEDVPLCNIATMVRSTGMMPSYDNAIF